MLKNVHSESQPILLTFDIIKSSFRNVFINYPFTQNYLTYFDDVDNYSLEKFDCLYSLKTCTEITVNFL